MTTTELPRVIALLARQLHIERLHRLAAKFETGITAATLSDQAVTLGDPTAKQLLQYLAVEWHQRPEVTSREIATALRSAIASRKLQAQEGSVDLVWSGPSSGTVPVRHTEQVLLEVIDSATTNLFIVSFVAYHVDSVTKALQAAATRGVKIAILLEATIGHGGQQAADLLPQLQRSNPAIDFYTWLPQDSSGVIHAKCAVADGKKAFITSANLTPAAMDRNMELGTLITGGLLPANLQRHLEALIIKRIVTPV